MRERPFSAYVVGGLEQELLSVYSSSSWRLTSPLRTAAEVVRRIRRDPGRQSHDLADAATRGARRLTLALCPSDTAYDYNEFVETAPRYSFCWAIPIGNGAAAVSRCPIADGYCPAELYRGAAWQARSHRPCRTGIARASAGETSRRTAHWRRRDHDFAARDRAPIRRTTSAAVRSGDVSRQDEEL